MRIKYLDVLKAFAIIAILLYHSGFLDFGYLGVDLFLVINGYLVTKTLCKRFMTPNIHSIWKEYAKFEISRIARLLPLLLMAGLLCMALGYFVMLPDDYENVSESVVATNMFGNNILAAITTRDYWAVTNEYKPLMHTWYVGLLMQFYIIYPILFFLARLNKKNPLQTLRVIVSSLAVISLLIYFGSTTAAQKFYYPPSRFFEFAAGALVALTWNIHKERNVFNNWFVYICYILLLAVFAINKEFVPANLKLVSVVALTVVLVMSTSALDNKITANEILSRIGAASYSIFVWHQVLLAFYRYTISHSFTVTSFSFFIISVGVLSWVTYHFFEKKTNEWFKEKNSRYVFIIITAVIFTNLTGFALYIYKKCGVVRDVPELYISKNEHVNHTAYNERINQYDRPFNTSSPHWLVVGNSFGRDFSNVILESPIANIIELSYIPEDNCSAYEYKERFATADIIFLSSHGTNEKQLREFEVLCYENGFNIEKLVIVGTKNFGESNGIFYVNRNNPDYFSQRTQMEVGFFELNEKMKNICGERYLDMIGLVIDKKNMMPVFTPDHHYVSQDCRHFTKGGAIWFAQLIDWAKYIE